MATTTIQIDAAARDRLRILAAERNTTIGGLDADVLRRGVAEHIGMLDVLDIVALDFAAVTWCSGRIRAGTTAGVAHAAYLAQPGVDRPDGRPVITRDPGDCKGIPGVRTIPVR